MISRDAVLEQVSRVLASRIFAGSERMCRLLRFCVGEVLAGRGDGLKEYLLGVEVFDRGDGFDPRLDPIVRVEARRLRSKLKTYYDGEGRGDSVIIELPTGCYAPRFVSRGSTPAARGVAVLPFTNLSADPGAEYFSDGLTEELIHVLTKIEGLRVVAWTSAAKLKGREQDIREVGAQLHVTAALTGSVRQSGERVRIIVRLVDVATGEFCWSDDYDRQTSDLLRVQEEIASAVAERLRLSFLGGQSAPVGRSSRSVEAHDLYLKGRYFWNRRTPESLERAIQYFSDAIALDAEFAPAHAGIADAYTLQTEYGLRRPSEVVPIAKAAALRALELDPALAEAYTSLGLIHSLNEWQWEQGERDYRRAIELNPGYATARHWYGADLLVHLGRFEEAIAQMQIGVELDPLSQSMNESYGYVLMLARRYDEALSKYQESGTLDPYYYKHYTAMGRVYICMGEYARAIEMLLKGRSLGGEVPTVFGALGQAYALCGKIAEARNTLAELARIGQERFVPSTAFALIHVGLNEYAQAMDWLERAERNQELALGVIGVHPGYDSVRGEPRFQQLLRRMGLGYLAETR